MTIKLIHHYNYTILQTHCGFCCSNGIQWQMVCVSQAVKIAFILMKNVFFVFISSLPLDLCVLFFKFSLIYRLFHRPSFFFLTKSTQTDIKWIKGKNLLVDDEWWSDDEFSAISSTGRIAYSIFKCALVCVWVSGVDFPF